MKKIKALLICFLLVMVSIVAIGCGDNNSDGNGNGDNGGFIEVYRVYYTTNNGSLSRYSKIQIEYEENVKIEQEEYDTISNDYYYTSSIDISRDKSNLEKFKVGDLAKSNPASDNYYKHKVKKVTYEYVAVKILNDKTITIKYENNKMMTISAIYFEIEYFI